MSNENAAVAENAIGSPNAHSLCHIHPHESDLTVEMNCTLYQGGEPVGFIDYNKDAIYEVVVQLNGGLRDHLCGYWCLCAHIECIGPDDPKPLPCITDVEIDPCDKDGKYTFSVPIPARTLSPGPGDCGQVCCFAATLSSKTKCGDQGHIFCFCKGPCVMVHKIPHE